MQKAEKTRLPRAANTAARPTVSSTTKFSCRNKGKTKLLGTAVLNVAIAQLHDDG
jgi:hypothetical protein